MSKSLYDGEVAEYVKSQLKYMKNVKSVFIWKEQGYKSFGTIASELVGMEPLRTPYNNFSSKYRKTLDKWNNVVKYSRRHSKEAYNCLLEFLWAYEDTIGALCNLIEKIEQWGLHRNPYTKQNCFISDGKKLGLREVIKRAYNATVQWNAVKSDLYKFANNK